MSPIGPTIQNKPHLVQIARHSEVASLAAFGAGQKMRLLVNIIVFVQRSCQIALKTNACPSKSILAILSFRI